MKDIDREIKKLEATLEYAKNASHKTKGINQESLRQRLEWLKKEKAQHE